jgi:hypothetical protein
MDDIASIVTQQGELARRRKLLEAMQGQNMGTQIQGGGRGNAIGQALAKVATAYMLAQGGEKLAGEEAANRGQYQGALQGELNNYLTSRDGQPAQELPGPTQDGQSPLMAPAVKGNPREAIVRAMTSQLPEMQAVGRADFASLRREQLGAKDMASLAEKFTPESIMQYQQTANPAALRLLPQNQVVNNQVVRTDHYGGKPTVSGDFRDKFQDPKPGIGGTLLQANEGTGEVKQVVGRPPVGTTVNVIPPAQKVGLEELAKQYAKNVSDMGEQARQAQRLSGALAQMGKLSDSGIFEGPLADPAIWVNRLASSAGIPVDKNKLSNSEAYGSVASEAVQRLVGQFGGNRGVTKEEAAVIAQIIPQLQASPQARAQMTQILQGMAERQMQAYKAAHQNYVKFVQTQDADQIDPTLYGSQMPIESPVPAQPGAGQRKPTVTNW